MPVGVGCAREGEDCRGRDALRGRAALIDRSLRTEVLGLDIDGGLRTESRGLSAECLTTLRP